MATLQADVAVKDWLHVGSLEELSQRKVIVVGASPRRIAVFVDGGDVYAVENNCPHMGFPLDRGAVSDGILTCHWHQARFDLKSGCTFDLWADDVPRFAVLVDAEGAVYVDPEPIVRIDADYLCQRLRRGLEQNIPLVQAKSLLALIRTAAAEDQRAGADVRDARNACLRQVLADVVAFASQNLNGFGEGLTRLTCIANLFDALSTDTAYRAILYATRRVGEEASASVPRRPRQALGASEPEAVRGGRELPTLQTWLTRWVQTRHRDGAERTILTALAALPPDQCAELIFTGAAERLYANGGHLLEEFDKAFDLVERLEPAAAADVLPLSVPSLVNAVGREESTNWHHPVAIVEPVRAIESALPELLAQPRNEDWQPSDEIGEVLLGDNPLQIIERLREELAAGAPPQRLARSVALAAAERLAFFATANEITDWFNPQHTFVFCNGVYVALGRTQGAGVVRAIFQGAIAVYQDRFLNVPRARLPAERKSRDALPGAAESLLAALTSALDERNQVDHAADIVSRYVAEGHPFDAGAVPRRAGPGMDRLIDRLCHVTVREDLDFHCLQVLEAGARQCRAWAGESEVAMERILVGVVRNLAAHCPTRRAGDQIATIARRLHAGERIYEG